MLFVSKYGWGKVKEASRSYLNVHFFLHFEKRKTVSQKVKQYPVLFDKQIKGYREKCNEQ